MRDLSLLPPGPFTTAMAADLGLGGRDLHALVGERRLHRLLVGVYADASLPLDLALRIRAVSLVLPPGGVVVDRTAAWLHGLDLFRRSSVFEAPPVEVYVVGGTRMRRDAVDSGTRALLPRDVTEIGGVPVTTPLRTCLDLARLMWRYDALGAIDQYLALGVPREEMLDELGRFRGFRWVRQARMLVPLGDPRAESMPESALRLHWYDALTAPPEPQLWVLDDDGHGVYRLDLGNEAMRYGAEYDGRQHHTASADVAYDERRRRWLDGRGWEVDPFTQRHVYDLSPHPVDVLQAGWERSRARHGLRRTA
ncbi:hypothetical protein [Nocardioides aequoreus]|uniref:hypothetical protein n=1 Tax=Nocardioides aequoreus TaxID=397278 RepID=UPI00068ACB3E|nr:hypothetical protein [Nocardioides aequoreus]